MKKFKKFLKNIRTEEKVIAVTGATIGASTLAMQAHAGSASTTIQNLLGYVFGIFFYIGVMLLAWGIGQLVLAFKNEDGDSKSRAIMLILASIVLMGITQIFNGLGLGVQATLNTGF